uniref:Platelet endothelial aggregation receptor 1 n=1 Tax=Bos indicus x Bos taurus TaxID=30522 RepID=A0A4W2FVF3_BOBOX
MEASSHSQPPSLPQRFVLRSVSMAAVWHPISANVCKTGGVTTAPVLVPQECGGRSVTSPATAATAAPVTPRVGHVPVPLACSPHTAFSPAPLASMALPASSAASAMGRPVTPRPEPASAPQREPGPPVRCPVHPVVLASPAPALRLAKMGESSRPPRIPAAAHLDGRAPSAPCPAPRASMDPTAPRNVAVTTEASATDSPGSVAVLRDTRGTGAARSAPWAASGRTVLRRVTAPRAPAVSRPTARVCANTASPGTAAPSASAPTASMASAARCPAPATRNTASGRPWDAVVKGSGGQWERPSVLKPPESRKAPGAYPGRGRDTDVAEGNRAGPRGRGCWGPPSERRGASLITLSTPRCSAPTTRRRTWGGGRSACGPRVRPPRARVSARSCHPMSGECSCLPGWAGLHCNESCPQDTHGPGCQEHCLCLHGGVCQPDSGLCRCAPGYTGPHCASLCPPDTYGVNCSQRCSCENAIACSPIDGTCVCKEGWQRGNCSVPCPPGTWGFGCNASCQCAHEAACSPQTGACTCTPGWHGTNCQLPCPKGQFGEGCASRCDCDHADGCDPVHGHCQCQAGWTGTRCHQPCPEGFWGANCSNACACRNGGTCIPKNGNCVCAPGFRGPFCQKSCQPGRYGKRCVPCKCANHSSCHPSNGTCYCLAGWTGPDCSQPCPLGHWGANCAQLCQCRHGGTCHPQDGSCFCPPGWTGHLCLEGCSPGMFGANCSQPCQCGPGERCHPETGACVCPPGHSGAPCRIGSQEPITMMPTPPVAYNSLGAVIGIAVLGSLVVALVALFIGYRHWQKGKEHQHLAVGYSSGRLDGSEYVMPDVPPSYSHYYSNPSYHTLSQCSPNPPPAKKVPGSQLFASLQASERPGGAHGLDNHATLPADWKHRREPPAGPLDRGSSRLDRSYSCSYSNSNGPGPFYSKGPISEEGLGASMASLSSENPYATIRDLPSLLGSPRESSYVEMKGPSSGSPPRQLPQLPDSQRRRHPQPQRDSGTYEQPSPLVHDRDSVGSQPPLPPGLPPGHYDSPKNSHIPVHYDLPPVRHPPSPPVRRQDR